MLRILFGFFILLPTLLMAHPKEALQKAYLDKGENYTPRTHHLNADGRAMFINHLILEQSPYLVQHAHNPINWYSWSDEAFDKAKKENKLIFLSIGYATCHWCHVMEEESFDNLEVAKLMNKHFIAIKVDREVQPDVDATFMNISRLTTGGGGWPLNVFLTPDGRAFLTDTYIDKERLTSVIPQLGQLWLNESERILSLANQNQNMVETIQNAQKQLKAVALNQATVEKTTQTILADFDEIQGGFGQAPKFPQESLLLFLLDEQRRNPSNETLTSITTTLDAMATGGFYDVIGGGFHRYSVDNAWMVPHFEKMLYNQAQLSLAYTRAYALTRNPLYKRIAQQTLDYTLREMQDEYGGFYSATDADSEGEEGTFFTWTENELKSILTDAQFQQAKRWFDLSKHTEFEDKNVIRFFDITQLQPQHYTEVDQLIDTIYDHRLKRIPPLTDDKVLLSWNALMIPSFIEAGQVFNNSKYINAGVALAQYLFDQFYKDGGLYRVSINQKTSTPALFEDYAYFTHALISVFDQTQDRIWLDRAEILVRKMNQNFWDSEYFGYHMNTGKKNLNSSIKQIFDDALPSTNGIAYQVLVKLFQRTGETAYQIQAGQLIGAYSSLIKKDPFSYVSFVQGFNSLTNNESSNVQYAYDGRVRIQNHWHDGRHLTVQINLKPGWHINAHKTLQDSLIATQLINNNPDIFSLSNIQYPSGMIKKLTFSDESIAIYENQIDISALLEKNTQEIATPQLTLKIQACSDKVCLAPTSVDLNL